MVSLFSNGGIGSGIGGASDEGNNNVTGAGNISQETSSVGVGRVAKSAGTRKAGGVGGAGAAKKAVGVTKAVAGKSDADKSAGKAAGKTTKVAVVSDSGKASKDAKAVKATKVVASGKASGEVVAKDAKVVKASKVSKVAADKPAKAEVTAKVGKTAKVAKEVKPVKDASVAKGEKTPKAEKAPKEVKAPKAVVVKTTKMGEVKAPKAVKSDGVAKSVVKADKAVKSEGAGKEVKSSKSVKSDKDSKGGKSDKGGSAGKVGKTSKVTKSSKDSKDSKVGGKVTKSVGAKAVGSKKVTSKVDGAAGKVAKAVKIAKVAKITKVGKASGLASVTKLVTPSKSSLNHAVATVDKVSSFGPGSLVADKKTMSASKVVSGVKGAGSVGLKGKKPVVSMKVGDVFSLLSRNWRGDLELRGKNSRLEGSLAVKTESDLLPKKPKSRWMEHSLSLMDRSRKLNDMGSYREVLRGVLLKKGDVHSAEMIRNDCDRYLRIHGPRRLRSLVQQRSVRDWKGYLLKRKGVSLSTMSARQCPKFLYYLSLEALLPMMEVVQVKKGGGAIQVPRPLSSVSASRRVAAGWRIGAAMAKSKGSSSPRYGAGVSLAREVLAVVSDVAYRREASRTRGLRGVVRSSLKSGALAKKIALYRLAKSNRSYRVGDSPSVDSSDES